MLAEHQTTPDQSEPRYLRYRLLFVNTFIKDVQISKNKGLVIKRNRSL